MSSGLGSLMAAGAAHAPRLRTQRPPRARRPAWPPAGTGSTRCRTPRPPRPSMRPSFRPDAADGEHRHALRQHRAPGLERPGRQRVGRKHLQPVRPGGDRGERLGRRRDARHADKPCRLRRAHDRHVAVRHHNEPAAGVPYACDVVDRDHRPGADEAGSSRAAAPARERREGARRVERHLETAKSRVVQRAGDLRDLLRRDAAKHRDQRQRREIRRNGGLVMAGSSLDVAPTLTRGDQRIPSPSPSPRTRGEGNASRPFRAGRGERFSTLPSGARGTLPGRSRRGDETNPSPAAAGDGRGDLRAAHPRIHHHAVRRGHASSPGPRGARRATAARRGVDRTGRGVDTGRRERRA